MTQRIYLDHAATTPLRREAAEALSAALARAPYNPSSLHAEGRQARAVLDDARARVASALGVRRTEVVFCGSGTEADNLALTGAARASRSRRKRIVSCAIEHHAVLHTLDALRDEGFDVTVLPVGADGALDLDAYAAALGSDTLLVTIAYANNEIGTVQPIAQLAQLAHAAGALFHTDAIQAPGWLPLDVPALGVDLLSLSGHKLFGPKGVGALYVRAGVAIAPVVHGGGQEAGLRSGTQNTAGIAAFARALELAIAERAERIGRVGALRDRLERTLEERVGDVRFNGARSERLAHVCSAAFAGAASESLLVALDLAGLAVSAGSACTSGALEPSHVIAALRQDPRWQSGVLRFSLGPQTTAEEIDAAAALVEHAVAAERRAAGWICAP